MTSGHTAAWYAKYGRVSKKIGDVGHPDVKTKDRNRDPDEPFKLHTVKDAEEFGKRVRAIIKDGGDPDPYIAARWKGKTHEEAVGQAASAEARADGAWTWEILVDKFLNKHIREAGVTDTGIRPPSKKTDREVTSILRHPDLEHLRRVLARDITKEQIEAVRNKWQEENRRGAQRKLITYTKSAMKWAKANHAAAKLGDVASWWLELRYKRYPTKVQQAKAEKRTLPRVLTPRDVAMALFVAEKHRIIPGRKSPRGTDEQTLALWWWVCLSVQRTHAAAVVRCSEVKDRTSLEGWYEVYWRPEDVKSKREHALAIPPEMYRRTIGRALADPTRRQSEWVFPSVTTKVRGQDSHIDRPSGDTILNNLLARLRGQREDGSGIDLLAEAGLEHFTPHSLRSALTTFLARMHVPAGTASAILDHAEKAPAEKPEEEESEVTRKHYNHAWRFELKCQGLRLWTEAVLAEYQKLLKGERVARFGLLYRSAGNASRIIASLAPEDRWLFDLHLPRLSATAPPGRLRLADLAAREEAFEPDGSPYDAPDEDEAA